jgi:hypothetical protein
MRVSLPLLSKHSADHQAVRPGAAALWAAFSLCAVTAVSLFFIPAFIIRPFRYQAPRALLVAMTLRQRAPLASLAAAFGSLVFALWLWRNVSRWGKSLIVLVLLVVTFSAVMTRLNYFEWMFHPLQSPQFIAQADSKLEAKEMILAVRMGGQDRAYPIRQMAYHHIVNDEVGGVPIAATY